MARHGRSTVLTFRGVLAALPDFLTAMVFLYVWLYAPARPHLVATMMLVMLIEFLVVHSAGMLGSIVYGDLARPAKTKAILGLGAMYGLFALGFSAGFDAWWPLFWLTWLLLSKLFVIWADRVPSSEQKQRLTAEWAAGVFFYVAGAFLTILPIVPRLSLTPALVSSLNLSGSGLWIDEPHRVIAFGLFYFVAMGVTKMVMLRTK